MGSVSWVSNMDPEIIPELYQVILGLKVARFYTRGRDSESMIGRGQRKKNPVFYPRVFYGSVCITYGPLPQPSLNLYYYFRYGQRPVFYRLVLLRILTLAQCVGKVPWCGGKRPMWREAPSVPWKVDGV